MQLKQSKGIYYLEFPHLKDLNWLWHFFSTRKGGVSLPPFDALNLGRVAGEKEVHLKENRRRVEEALGVYPKEPLNLEHGTRTLIVRRKADFSSQTADALLTATPELTLCITFADCFPIFLADPEKKVIGLIHGGWRCILGRIIPQALAELRADFGSSPADLLVGIGPGIQGCCFSLEQEQAGLFLRAFPAWQDLSRQLSNKWYIELKEIIFRELLLAGVKEANIGKSPLCTSCSKELFYSYRRDNRKTGRMAAVIRLKGGG